MGKGKKPSKTNPEALKEAGNKSFSQGQFEEAIEFYTKAIQLKNDSHIYFSNRK